MGEMQKLIQEKLDGLTPLEREVIILRVFREFAKEMFKLSDWPEGGDIDGADFQDAAVKCGLLIPETRYAPCSEDGCRCAEYYGGDDFELGVTCYRISPVLKGGTS